MPLKHINPPLLAVGFFKTARSSFLLFVGLKKNEERAVLLCVWVFENHVLRGTRIDRRTSARDVSKPAMQNCEPFPVVHHQKFYSLLLMVKSYRFRECNPHRMMPIIMGIG